MLTRFPPLKEGITLVRRVGPKNQDCKGHAGCALTGQSWQPSPKRPANGFWASCQGRAVSSMKIRPIATGCFDSSNACAKRASLCPEVTTRRRSHPKQTFLLETGRLPSSFPRSPDQPRKTLYVSAIVHTTAVRRPRAYNPRPLVSNADFHIRGSPAPECNITLDWRCFSGRLSLVESNPPTYKTQQNTYFVVSVKFPRTPGPANRVAEPTLASARHPKHCARH